MASQDAFEDVGGAAFGEQSQVAGEIQGVDGAAALVDDVAEEQRHSAVLQMFFCESQL